MTPAQLANLEDPEQIRRMIRIRESMMCWPLAWGEKKEIHAEMAALEERYLELTGEGWRP